MSTEPHPDIEQLFEQGTPIDEAMNEAVRMHKLLGQPLAVWRDGKVVWISAEEAEHAIEAASRRDPS